MEYTTSEIVLAVIIVGSLDKKERFEKNKGEKHDSRSDL